MTIYSYWQHHCRKFKSVADWISSKIVYWAEWHLKRIEFWLSEFESYKKNINASMQKSFNFIDRIA
jgi:hypothetical protein